MAGFTKREAFIAQVAFYLKNEDYKQAYPMAKELVTKFPDDMLGHYLLSKAAFWSGKYDESINEGRKAFNMSNEKDMLICAILMASAFFKAGRYREGYDFLSSVKEIRDDKEVRTMLFLFSYALKNEKAALEHAEMLYRMDKDAALSLVSKFTR